MTNPQPLAGDLNLSDDAFWLMGIGDEHFAMVLRNTNITAGGNLAAVVTELAQQRELLLGDPDGRTGPAAEESSATSAPSSGCAAR